MTPDLEAVLRALLERSAREGRVALDDFAEALGALGATPDDVELAMDRFEAGGGVLVAPEGGGGEARLKVVLAAARALRAELGRTPTAAEIAARAGMDLERVRQALALGRAMR